MGSIDDLGSGRGHLAITFDPDEKADREKARRTVVDLLVKGDSLVVHEDGDDRKVTSFDPEKFPYRVV